MMDRDDAELADVTIRRVDPAARNEFNDPFVVERPNGRGDVMTWTLTFRDLLDAYHHLGDVLATEQRWQRRNQTKDETT